MTGLSILLKMTELSRCPYSYRQLVDLSTEPVAAFELLPLEPIKKELIHCLVRRIDRPDGDGHFLSYSEEYFNRKIFFNDKL